MVGVNLGATGPREGCATWELDGTIVGKFDSEKGGSLKSAVGPLLGMSLGAADVEENGSNKGKTGSHIFNPPPLMLVQSADSKTGVKDCQLEY